MTSILVVVFANDERLEGKDNITAAVSSGYTRLRPVCMTALAMIIGMLPMALALGEGGEQNAPLGRAVIGGLLLATLGTLFVVPIMYSLLRKDPPRNFDEEIDRAYHEGEQAEGTAQKQTKSGLTLIAEEKICSRCACHISSRRNCGKHIMSATRELQ